MFWNPSETPGLVLDSRCLISDCPLFFFIFTISFFFDQHLLHHGVIVNRKYQQFNKHHESNEKLNKHHESNEKLTINTMNKINEKLNKHHESNKNSINSINTMNQMKNSINTMNQMKNEKYYTVEIVPNSNGKS